MPTLPEHFLQHLQSGGPAALGGTDLRFDLHLSTQLLNLAIAPPADAPIDDLRLRLTDDGRAVVFLAAGVPILGVQTRQIEFYLTDATYNRDEQDEWLRFRIASGLKMIDKPLIGLLRGQIEKNLPAGIQLTSSELSLHVPRLLTGLGYGYLLPLLAGIQLTSHADKLSIQLHLQA
ncbi:MAG: hypothetical protein WBA17_10965 [Saprospiraceae bacterium]